MAHLLNIEKSKFINSQIAYKHNLKLNQYSKFLNKNPIYCTYYSINKAMSKTDVGTGNIVRDIGPDSPLRFNKILEFPLYNVPELVPNIDRDDNTGIDIDMEVNDITILPGTLKPMESDFIILTLPGSHQVMIRVISFSYNTIESNDFYQLSGTLYRIAGAEEDLHNRIEPQVVETYQTIFENIGTQDKCFLRTDEFEKVKSLLLVLEELKRYYISSFYNMENNSFVLYCNPAYPDYWFYDYMISKFINESRLFNDTYSDTAILPTYNDIVPMNVDNIFMRTLWYAILKRDTKHLNRNTYYFQFPINTRISSFTINNIKCNGVKFHLADIEKSNPCWKIEEYFPSKLINAILNPTEDNLNDIISDYLDQVIYNFVLHKNTDIDYEKILEYAFMDDMKTYRYMPAIIYILRVIYDEYFISNKPSNKVTIKI